MSGLIVLKGSHKREYLIVIPEGYSLKLTEVENKCNGEKGVIFSIEKSSESSKTQFSNDSEMLITNDR